MPQKLIRLTSDSGDGIFKGIFNQEIEIKEDSEIALQSLSLERLSASVKISSDNNQVKFSSVNLDPQNGVIVPTGIYDNSNTQEFFTNISNAMNRTCNAFINSKEQQWGIQHFVFDSVSGKVQVGARISPFYQIQKWQPSQAEYFRMSFVQVSDFYNEHVPNAEPLNIWREFQVAGNEHGMWRLSDTTTGGGGTEPELNESYIFGSEAMTKSTGAFRARFKRLNTDGAGTAGFTMGLVKGEDGLSKAQNGSMTLADFSYAIRVNGHATPIQYINKIGSTSADFISTVTPVNHTLQDWQNQLNDVLDIRIGGGQLYGHITSQADDAATPIKTRLNSMIDYDQGADYYWVISVHEGFDKVVLDLVGVTLDPVGTRGSNFGTSTDQGDLGQESSNAFVTELPANGSGESLITGLPVPNQLGPTFTPEVKFDPIVSTYLGFATSDLNTRTMPSLVIEPPVDMIPNGVNGFPDASLTYSQDVGYTFTADVGFDNTYDSDTYIIDTQTFTLDSYDSYGLSAAERSANSGGSRRNIIATIPVTEVSVPGSSNSIIQYEPSTQNYIQIKNRGDIVTRQIRCRLLTGMYQPVKTEGLASIVLLIKE